VTRRRRLGLGAAAAVVGLVAGTVAIRHVPFFRVRQVEVVGVRYLPVRTILSNARIRPDHNIFEDLDRVAARVRAIPGVTDASASRRLPGTLRIGVAEAVPRALVPGPGGMVALDARARPLPFDPAAGAMALPIVARPDSTLTETLAAIADADAELYGAIETVEQGRGGVVVRVEGCRMLFNGVPSVEAIGNAAAVWRHLGGRRARFRVVDARYAGRVFVRGNTA